VSRILSGSATVGDCAVFRKLLEGAQEDDGDSDVEGGGRKTREVEGIGRDGRGEEGERGQTKDEVSNPFCRAAANACDERLLMISPSNSWCFDHAVWAAFTWMAINICAMHQSKHPAIILFFVPFGRR
jgi:hypothetical protein